MCKELNSPIVDYKPENGKYSIVIQLFEDCHDYISIERARQLKDELNQLLINLKQNGQKL